MEWNGNRRYSNPILTNAKDYKDNSTQAMGFQGVTFIFDSLKGDKL